jgi:predicted DNA repair protein MutK
MTVGVYGLVAAIVKMDDAGVYLSAKTGGLARNTGKLLLATAPRLMKVLSVVGTAAMFMVGGGIIAHAWAPLHHFSESTAGMVAGVPGVGGVLAAIAPTVVDAIAGVIVGALVLVVVTLVQRMRGKKAVAH